MSMLAEKKYETTNFKYLYRIGFLNHTPIWPSMKPYKNSSCRTTVFTLAKNGRWLLTKDQEKSKEELIQELEKLRQENAILEVMNRESKQGDREIRMLYEAIETIPSIVVLTDTKGNIEYVNPKFMEITGYSREEAIGKNMNILKSDEQPSETYDDLWDIISTGKEWKGEFHNSKKNGDLYWEAALIFSIKNLEGKVEHYFKVAEDITERKEHEQEILNVITNTAHLINTPLTVALGHMEMVKLGFKKMDQNLTNLVYDKVHEVGDLVRNRLIANVKLLTKETSDGWTPVKKKKQS